MDTALLIIDVQMDYFPGGKMELAGSTESSENIKKVIALFREQKQPIIHIQHISLNEKAPFFIPGTEGIEFHKNVMPIDGEMIIQKHFPNSFLNTSLHKFCQENGIKNLVVAGMMTHMCIDTTVRAAFDLGYTSTLLSDCTATRNLAFENRVIEAKDVQASFLAALNGLFAKVISTSDYVNQES